MGIEQSELLKKTHMVLLVPWNSSPSPSKSTERGLERDLDSTVSKQMAIKVLLNHSKMEDDAKQFHLKGQGNDKIWKYPQKERKNDTYCWGWQFLCLKSNAVDCTFHNQHPNGLIPN